MKASDAIAARQPARDQPLRVLARAALVHGVRQRMRRVCVVCLQVIVALREGSAERHAAVFGMRPASVGEKPLVVGGKVPSIALTELHARLIVIRDTGEGEEPEDSERIRTSRGQVDVRERRFSAFAD